MDRRKIIGIICIAIAILVLALSGMLFEDVDKNDILIVKALGTGNISIYTTTGWKWQGGGDVTHLKKRFQFWFSSKKDQGDSSDQSVRARFNDNGHANISGSISMETPLTEKEIFAVYDKYGSQDAVEKELIRTVFEKAVYMSGPLMSSTESASAKRNQLIYFIEDQAQNGVYKTLSREEKTKDPITGAEKTITIVELIKDSNSPLGIARQELSPLQTFGYKASNMSINEVKYDDDVEKQITTQQKAIMDVQIAMAESRKAEQRVLTVAKEGEANAAKAKWEQEVFKSIEVTKAEKRKDVAELDLQTAELKKQALIKIGQGEAEKRRLIMAADGALKLKLETYERVMGRATQSFGQQKWVPDIQMGSTSSTTGSHVTDLMNLLSVQVAKDMGLDLSIKQK